MKNHTRVMVFGTFDYLHAGHENLFQQANKLGDEIITVIARDRTVRQIKGAASDHNEQERKKNLEGTGWSTLVVLGNQKDKTKVIRDFKPDIIALGYDQFAFTYRLEKFLMDIRLDARIVRLKPYHPDMYKSSLLKYNSSNETSPLLIPATAENYQV